MQFRFYFIIANKIVIDANSLSELYFMKVFM